MVGDSVPFGDRLKRHRERLGMSRPVLGGLVGKSADWVKAVETGRLLTPRLPMLLRLAEVLQVGGGNGDDTLYGEAGNDANYGETFLGSLLGLFDNGNDHIYGGVGTDNINVQDGLGGDTTGC